MDLQAMVVDGTKGPEYMSAHWDPSFSVILTWRPRTADRFQAEFIEHRMVSKLRADLLAVDEGVDVETARRRGD